MAELNSLSTTDASNTANWPEGMARNLVNNAGRADEGMLARFDKDNNGSLVTAGISTAYTVTLNSQHAAWFNGLRLRVRFNAASGAAPTINPTGSAALGAKTIVHNDGTAVAANDIAANAVVDLEYNLTTDKVHILSAINKPASTGAANLFTALQKFSKGADIASASPLVIGTDGNYFDVTGTTGFSAMTVAAGALFMLQFDGALTMTHGASLDLGGANIATAAGDRGLFYATAANTVELIAWSEPPTQAEAEAGTATIPRPWTATRVKQAIAALAAGGKLVQRTYATYATYTSTAAGILHDDTIPQNTEGAETVTQAITMANATNRVRITAIFNAGWSAANSGFVAALFKDAGANALAVQEQTHAAANGLASGVIVYEEVPGDTSSHTYKLRVGPNPDAGAAYFNGNSTTRLYGGVAFHALICEELTP